MIPPLGTMAVSRDFPPCPFVEGTTIGVCADAVYKSIIADPTWGLQGSGRPNAPRRVWTTVDCSQWVPAGTKAVAITGIMLITQGTTSKITCVKGWFKRTDWTPPPDDTIDNSWDIEVVAVGPTDGIRSTFGVLVPLSPSLTFDYMWDAYDTSTPTVDTPPWPTGMAAAINMRLNAYMR